MPPGTGPELFAEFEAKTLKKNAADREPGGVPPNGLGVQLLPFGGWLLCPVVGFIVP